MMMRLIVILVLLWAAALSGCQDGWTWQRLGPKPQATTARSPAAAVIAEKDQRIRQLEGEVVAVQARVEELRQRAARLEDQVRKLEFMNDQLARQLDAVGQAPRERDLALTHLEEAQADVQLLRQRVNDLERRLELPLTTWPATMPATRPATEPGATTLPAAKMLPTTSPDRAGATPD